MNIPSPLLGLYGIIWRVARPFLRRHKRLSHGFDSRLVPSEWPYISSLQKGDTAKNDEHSSSTTKQAEQIDSRFDFWIQAASGGEAYLSFELLKELAKENEPLKILCTSCTEQGLLILQQAQEALADSSLTIIVAYLPLDEPKIMKRAIRQVFHLEKGQVSVNRNGRKPRLVLMETEIWPGLLYAAKSAGVEIMILNGRMTIKSLKAYNYITPFLRKNAPDLILATSPEDLERMVNVFYAPTDKEAAEKRSKDSLAKIKSSCGLMHNIKFDRIQMEKSDNIAPEKLNSDMQSNIAIYSSSSSLPDNPDATQALDNLTDNPLNKYIKSDCKIVVFASIRKEEESLLLSIISKLEHKSGVCVVVAPRHMHRVDAWASLCNSKGLKFEKRSEFESFTNGGIVLWDSFGEMMHLYSIASVVFVGGSMAPLGGQNFLEPLSCGLEPCIGPYWSNFYWTGTGVFERKLVHKVETPAMLGVKMVELVNKSRSRDEVKADFYEYIEQYKGGARRAALAMLSKSPLQMAYDK